MDNGAPGTIWTRAQVEARLVAAFRAMPSCPIYRIGPVIRAVTEGGNALTAVLNWATILDRDPGARAYLWAWARCQATHESFGEHCGLRGWKRPTAEAGRRRAAETIAQALSKDPTLAKNWTSSHLDSKKTPVGSNDQHAAELASAAP